MRSKSSGSFKPLVVRPTVARAMLAGCGTERLYQLLHSGELESFRDGRARLILVASIERYIADRLAQSGGMSPSATPPRVRGRPPKARPAQEPISQSPAAMSATRYASRP